MTDCNAGDCKLLLAELKEEDSRIRLKRRWLMDLPMSEKDQKRIKTLDPLSDKSIPESMIREDDVYYDNIKNFVERVSGTSTYGKELALCPEKNRLKNFSSSECFRGSAITVMDMLQKLPPPTLEAMLRRLKAKTRSSIPKLVEHRKIRLKHKLVRSVRTCCMKLLRKLDEGKHPPESLVEALSIAGLTLKVLLGHTHVTEFKRFSPEVEDLQRNIAKAIHLINTRGRKVNDNLLEVVWKKLLILSEREIEISKKDLRNAVRDRLIEYLVECSDMESIPKLLVELLNDINNRSRSSSSGSTSKNEKEEEVEFLLCFSAQIKQVIWDILPDEEEVDQDFATAYMEESEDNDEEDYTNEFLASQDFELDSNECDSVIESIGETKPDQSPVSTQKAYDSPLLKQEPQESDSFRSNAFSSFSYRNQSLSRNRPSFATFEDLNNEAKPDDSELKTNREDTLEGHMQGQFGTSKNKYMSIQRACDETAMAMHRTIDGILNELAKS